MCGAAANSSEHRIKKADLVRSYGTGPYHGPSAPVHVRDGAVTPIQGPRAKKLKYSPSLCEQCNNARTQTHDRAYDHFVSWVLANEEPVLYRRFVDFAEVYGSDFEDPQRDLFKYFVKSFGCRLVDAGEPAPEDLVALLPLKSFRTALKITFCVNEDILLLPEPTRSVFVGKGELTTWVLRSNPPAPKGYIWDEHVSWLTVRYWYDREPDGSLGSTWIANTQFLYLGSFEPLSSEQRAELLEKVRNDPDTKNDS